MSKDSTQAFRGLGFTKSTEEPPQAGRGLTYSSSKSRESPFPTYRNHDAGASVGDCQQRTVGRLVEIIRAAGNTCGTEIFSDESAYRGALRDKLVEEAVEGANASQEDLAAELADVREVFDALMKAYALDRDTVRALQEKRRAQRGGFAHRLRLLWTE